jgi:hypothetical protein
MAKRKAASAASRRAAAGRNRARPASRKSAKGSIRKTKKATQATKRATPARKNSGARAGAQKATARKAVARKSASAARKSVPVKRTAATTSARSAPSTARKAPALSRARRTIQDEDIVPSPPSSLDLDRRPSAARSGRKELKDRQHQITQTGPVLTAGDVDADWESADSIGDEAPGGDNPTPDQDVVDDIGKAIGVEYEDNEELKSEEKIVKRDRHRWELDPASSEDYNER